VTQHQQHIFEAGQAHKELANGSNGPDKDPLGQMFTQFATWYTNQQNSDDIALNTINLN
jgi:hypothetical protein